MLDVEDGRSNYVVFEPGARTHWHQHSGIQVLYVVAGEGAVATASGERTVIRAGDVVYFPARERHWHGAGPSSLMAHIALTLGENEWLDEVSDADYGAAF
jgi:quercetin dioxygenase-like cupin family protein